ncbi:MAG: DUF4230 domain-containing protein [Saprospiraceae bacterium]|nr:DUF4230 domain-containing protein [Saprospiraceae bacterium]
MATEQPDLSPGTGNIFGSQIVLLALIVVAALVVYNLYFNDSWSGGPGKGSRKSREIQLDYVPSDFKPNLDEGATLQILSQPERYRKEFNDLVYNFNLSLLYHVANRMNLPDSLKRQLEPEYKKHHEYLANLYYFDFVNLKDTTANLYEDWYSDNANNAVTLFNEVSGKYTCFFITQIMSVLLKAGSTRLMGKGKDPDNPCAIAVNEGLRPMVDRLKKQADIYDFSNSRGMLKEKVRKGIAELATYELRSRLGIDKSLQYKLFGINISDTDIRIEAISVIKAGFKLDQRFDITFNPRQAVVFVTLPQPTILSHEVYPRVDKLDVGVLAGVSNEELNRNFNELRRQFRQDALENEKVLDKAKMRADSVMQLLLGPTVRAMGKNYKLQIRYDETPAPVTEDELRRQGIENGAATKPDPSPQRPTIGQ